MNYCTIILYFQKRKKKFSLAATKTEFDFRPVYNEPSPDFFEFKPVVNDVFRALIAARKPKYAGLVTLDPEARASTVPDQSINTQTVTGDDSYVPKAEVFRYVASIYLSQLVEKIVK